MLWIKSSALIMNFLWNRKVFVGDESKKLKRGRPLNCSIKIIQTSEFQSCHFTSFFAETSIELVSTSILSLPLDVILHLVPLQRCSKHWFNERLIFLSLGRMNWIFLPISHFTRMCILHWGFARSCRIHINSRFFLMESATSPSAPRRMTGWKAWTR